MATKSPIFPMPEPQHFSDYGFDPQIDYFQVLEEARKHKRETASRSIDSLHFKLQKPISKDESKRIKKSKRRWWRKALLFLRRRWTRTDGDRDDDGAGVHRGRAYRGSISGPMYITECTSGPARRTGPSAGRRRVLSPEPYRQRGRGKWRSPTSASGSLTWSRLT
ncbi:hypothetical protein Acr_20g0008580 [Actinidia rufa]|uniref:Uncharacterized protein n=1 Tax=Actinidia rufa TaxID=165716 RepID=A0A7J0GE02_9ERIC|nr:hypothetical protein Acr_20g0008580 [Actinidia rufa]